MKIVASIALVLMLACVVPVYASTATFTNTTQTVGQMNWRAAVTAFGTISYSFDDSGPYYSYTATGNSLHETFSYAPSVTDLSGASHVYTFAKGTGNYMIHSGVVSYTSPYSGMTIYEVWNGSISFGGALITSTNLVVTSGQLNQWGFVYYPGSTPPSFYPNAQSMGEGYWLVGFSTYTYGSPISYTPPGTFFALALAPPHLP